MTKKEDHDKILKDGGVLKVSMFAMDSTQRAIAQRTPSGQHKPGHLPVTDADRARRVALAEAKNKQLADAWKGDGK